MARALPSRPDLEQLRKQAKELQKSFKSGDGSAIQRVRENHPQGGDISSGRTRFSLSDAQLVLAREHGFASWPRLKAHVQETLLSAVDPMTLVHEALRNDDATLFRKVIERHPDLKARINQPAEEGFHSPIITLARSRRMLDAMLAAGADINAMSTWWAGGFGLLHTAPAHVAEYAVQRGAVVDVHAAARLGRMDTLRELVEADQNLVHARGGDGQTPLHFAATAEVAAFLLDRGAEIDALDVDHESTPAQYMVQDRQDVLRYLIRRGCKTDILMAAALGDIELARRHLEADPGCIRVRVSQGYFPMVGGKTGGTIYQWALGWHVSAHQVARRFGHEEMWRFLNEHSPTDVLLLNACWLHDEAGMRSILRRDPEVLARISEPDRQQVAHAARNNDCEAVGLMLAAGLPVDSRGQHSATPLHWAAWHGNAPMVELILRYNPALEDARNDFNGTPLRWAIHGSENGWHRETGDYARTVELLIGAGAKLPPSVTGSESVKRVLQKHMS
jgi:hypothetical protein